MKKKFLVIFVLGSMLSSTFVFALDKKEQDVPKGMEVIKTGTNSSVLVPKGAKTKKVGSKFVVEGTREYMARRFAEIDERLEKIEKAQEELNRKILKVLIKEMKEE
ncbi:MAG: hypothetical protein KAJ18_02565 [Candidatus Omnitrophica bacterium]|nr:hypothetical protein [Candidatus Omnitrophota bacterium]